MTATEDTKQVNIRTPTPLINEVDRVILQARADGELPMSYNRSDALRDLMRQLADDPSILSDYGES